jgi:hypothetical protein
VAVNGSVPARSYAIVTLSISANANAYSPAIAGNSTF